jgi:archaellum biogenesis protein FlaJ (TadC family)
MQQEKQLPREAISASALGSLLMGIFTAAWASIANVGFQGRDHYIFLALFLLFVVLFIINAISLYKASKRYPAASTAADKERKKKTGMWFGIIFGLEGITIPIAVNIVIFLGHPELVIPAMALVVGLHFYPMATIFQRKIDYYLATWATLIALAGFYLSLKKNLPESDIRAFIGVGLGMATSAYGFYTIWYGRRLLQRQNQ